MVRAQARTCVGVLDWGFGVVEFEGFGVLGFWGFGVWEFWVLGVLGLELGLGGVTLGFGFGV